MQSQPKVSIICTVYNKERWLERVIESFLMQETNFPFEILLVDDASSDQSPAIIERFAKDYPDLIRPFYHTSNQGIAKTWVSICKEAKGEYIARCDGDDFWLDSLKLQKQVDLLEKNPDSKWSNTDFDIYDENSNFVSAAGFETGTIPLADDFEKMLTTRGFTMASTWLVERQLMLAVNEELDLATSDDTFNLQLDLFKRTRLSYLPQATVAYTVNRGSDSRPKEFCQIERRFNNLLQTQKDYLEKYPDSDSRKMLDILLERNNRYELELTKRELSLGSLSGEKVKIYFSVAGSGFSEDNILEFPLKQEDQFSFQLPEGCDLFRVDLSEKPSYYAHFSLVSQVAQTEVEALASTGFYYQSSLLFPNPDPQLIFPVIAEFGREFVLSYQLYNFGNETAQDYVSTVLANHLQQARQKIYELESYQREYHRLKEVEEQFVRLTHQYNSVIHSRRWTIPTKIIQFFRRK
ncbi:glycosyltransferase [Streptococcus oriscaviae]|uniref:Glycosyltransferase n=1 Tax=Streptococcus oriscaviae TaxID=2781599 RepID=A0ABX7YL84_9STRE|nr:glycosyltransferase family 2 protein [Streptococcus oriscaviae]QUE54387.1 glycosyltransferase [Streptococcus oriscaviae]